MLYFEIKGFLRFPKMSKLQKWLNVLNNNLIKLYQQDMTLIQFHKHWY